MSHSDDEIDLAGLVALLWRWKVVLFLCVSLAAAVSVVVALNLNNVYRAEALLAPVQGESRGGLGRLAAQYGSLAGLAGIGLGGEASGDKTTYAMEILKSRQFFAEFLSRHNGLVPLMAARSWDRSTRDLILDPETYDSTKKRWVRKVSPPKQAQPSVQEAHDVYLRLLAVQRDEVTGLVTVSFEHVSPIVAKQWVDWLVADVNELIRQQDVTEATQTIDYLNKQVKETTIAEINNALFSLIEDQIKIVMLANVRKEYALKTIDPAVVPEKKHKPNRAMISLIGCLVGVVVGVVLAVLLDKRYGSRVRYPI